MLKSQYFIAQTNSPYFHSNICNSAEFIGLDTKVHDRISGFITDGWQIISLCHDDRCNVWTWLMKKDFDNV